ncbi:MAG: helicase-exonuclease AddAB subunit AddA, partial [Lachnospiraceae bacterium]|nr:helicase-exonuclease AddAB subunit AddA [Lachnospiraceae bacterium]
IDSFCNHVVRSHFDELDMDPDFRIGDEGELKLIRGDLIQQLLEDRYASGDPEFYELVETTATGKTDSGIEEWIEKLYFFVSAYPFPKQTLEAWAAEYVNAEEAAEEDGVTEKNAVDHGVSTAEADTPAWLAFLLDQLHREAEELITQYDQAIRMAMTAGGPAAYVDMFVSDRELAQQVRRANDYDGLQQALEEMRFTRKPTIRDKSADPELKELLSAFRDERKKAMQKWKEHYAFPEREEMLRQMAVSSRPLRTLCQLTAEFMERFDAYKKEKHLLDFSDLEHLALQILVTEEEGQIVPSAVARQMQNCYREVMIDEYQDSNLVQEMLLGSVAGHWRGQPNQFMVGDVKQSIYKFRMARPEIFMEKYASYTTEDSTSQKIDLHKNFRSRPEVLDSANFVFRQIMAESLGGITYDDQSALHVGASFPEPESIRQDGGGDEELPKSEHDYTTELLLVDLSDDDGYRKDIDPREAEAKAIAARIRQLTDEKSGLQIWDSQEERYRTARYGDIVILLRTFTGWADTFVNVLLNAGIPAFAQSATGYFTALEVQTVLNCLRVLDNPMQDIPLASVLHSPMGGFSSEEMAQMQAAFRKAGSPGGVRGMYGACRYLGGQIPENDDHYGESVALAEDTPLGRKAAAFLQQMEGLRRKALYLPLHELLQHVYTDTGYYELVSVMPDGAVRRANLDMLMEKTIAYESTSYYGLFDFVRYIENLHKYDIDFGEAAPDGESGDTVRITTIHKSKGLEYPVVFVAGCGKSFNQQDSRSRILMHPDLGLASDYVDTELRLRTSTLKKQVLARKLTLDNLGEELRVLYVAMTRAKEKLILTGTDKYLRRKLDKQSTLVGWPMEALPSSMVAGAGSYLDWFLMCLGRGADAPIRKEIIPFGALFVDEIESQLIRHETRRQLEQWD